MRLNLFSWALLLCGVVELVAEVPDTSRKTREISLDEAVRTALQQNLAIRLGQTTPEEARAALARDQGYYDPIMSGNAGQKFTDRPGNFDATLGVVLPGSENWVEDYGLKFNGALPTGTRYELGWSLERTSGTAFDPSSGTFFNIPFQYASEVHISVTQPLLKDFWIDSGRTTIKVRKKEIKMSELDLQFTVMDIVNKVANAYYDLRAKRDLVTVGEIAVKLKEQLLAENRKKVQVGTLAPLDEKQAESEAATARADLTLKRLNAEQAENALKALIVDNFAALHSVSLEPSEKLLSVHQEISLAESWRNGLELRPDYLRIKEDLERQNIILKFRANQLYPALDLVASYGRNGLGGTTSDSLDSIADNRFPKWGGAVVLTVPLTRRTDRYEYKRQQVTVKNALLTLKQMEEKIVRDIDDAVKKVQSAYAAIASTHEARVFAEAALDAEQKKLENGKSTSFQVLSLQDKVTTARSDEIAALTVYNKALHDFYFSEGTNLRRAKVDVQVK